MKPTPTQLETVMSGLSPGDLTSDGRPRMGALNRALKAAGHGTITAAARDDMLASILTDDNVPAPQPAPETTARAMIRIHEDAGQSPVTITVNGRLRRLPVDVEIGVSAGIVECLRNAAIPFTLIED